MGRQGPSKESALKAGLFSPISYSRIIRTDLSGNQDAMSMPLQQIAPHFLSFQKGKNGKKKSSILANFIFRKVFYSNIPLLITDINTCIQTNEYTGEPYKVIGTSLQDALSVTGGIWCL